MFCLQNDIEEHRGEKFQNEILMGQKQRNAIATLLQHHCNAIATLFSWK